MERKLSKSYEKTFEIFWKENFQKVMKTLSKSYGERKLSKSFENKDEKFRKIFKSFEKLETFEIYQKF